MAHSPSEFIIPAPCAVAFPESFLSVFASTAGDNLCGRQKGYLQRVFLARFHSHGEL